MSRRLPPLNALRAFESAARHLSFTKAAEELGVTPAAVSHQVKGLEDALGVALFRRTGRAVLLTEAGQLCLPGLSEGFARLAAAMDKVRAGDGSVLTVSTTPAFAAKWLVPRLERFRARHPHLDVRISSSFALVDFRATDVDVAVRFGRGRYPGLRVDPLFSDCVAPMCSPRLARGKPPLKRPADLARHVLLHDDAMRFDSALPDWAMWLKAAGVEGVDAGRGLRFSNSELALQAAIEGAGVVLGRRRLAAADLRAGRLVAPFALSLPLDFSYYVVAPEETAERPKVRAFRDWLLAEAAADPAAC